jgi:RecA-family ATPase
VTATIKRRNLRNIDDRTRLIAAITAAIKDIAVPVRAIAIDTLRKATPGKSENDSKDMSVLLSNCDFLANTFNCHVNAVHHSPRSDDTRGSGTNAIEGSCDVILPVTRRQGRRHAARHSHRRPHEGWPGRGHLVI